MASSARRKAETGSAYEKLPKQSAHLSSLALEQQIPFVQMALQTEKNYFRINYAFHSRYRYRRKLFEFIFGSRYRDSCSLQPGGGGTADQNCFGHNFYFIADTDTEKYYFRIISAMISDKR